MNRCFSARLFLTTCLTLPLASLAQTGTTTNILTDSSGATVAVRTFPANAVRGKMQVTTPPEVILDNKTERLSPGARIHATNGLLVVSGSLVGQTVPVMVLREASGMLREVWVLTDAEAALIPGKAFFTQ